MKIALVDMANLKYMPYVKCYLDVIDLSKTETHVIHWKRETEDSTQLDSRVSIHTYEKLIDSSQGLKEKLLEIGKYSCYLHNELKKLSPDFLIVHYQTTAFLIFDLLMGKYKNRYILDYRDITYERHNWFRMLVSRIIKNSVYTFISSEGFKKYLPNMDKIHISHNVDFNLIHKAPTHVKKIKEKHTPVRIAFWGRIRNDRTNRAFIEAVSASQGVELHYYGIFNDCTSKKPLNTIEAAKNVFYHGAYSSADRRTFADATDLLLNVFDKDDKNMPFATSNKFYDGLLFNIPQICASGSIMGNKCEKLGVGIAINIEDPDFLTKIITYYHCINFDTFIENCDNAKKLITKDVNEFAFLVSKMTNGGE